VKRIFLSLSLLALTARQALAGAQEGVDFTDGFGGFVGLFGVFFFVYLCFRGDKKPPEGLPKK
jgi:hypothetical protein